MHQERWRELVERIKDGFSVEEHATEELDEDGGKVERVIFQGPLGKMKLEFISRPKVLDKKTIYSNRIGSEVQVEYILSPTERVNQLLICRWSEAEDDWLPVEAESLGL